MSEQNQPPLFTEPEVDITHQWDTYCQAEHDWYLHQTDDTARRMRAAYSNIRASSINALVEEVKAARPLIEAIRSYVDCCVDAGTEESFNALLRVYDKVVKR